MMKSLIPLALILSPAGIPMLAAAPAQAGQSESVRISYVDLDLSRDADRKVLDRRINRALEQVCGSVPPGSLNLTPESVRCRVATKRAIAAKREQAVARRTDAVRISAVP